MKDEQTHRQKMPTLQDSQIYFYTHQNLKYMQYFIQFFPLGLCGETQNQAKTKIFNFYTHPVSIEIAQPSFFEVSSG